MRLTRVFKFGEDQAVLIPEDLAYSDLNIELDVSRVGDVITIKPVGSKRNLKEMVAALRSMPKPSEIEKYEPIELPDRE